ncbi:MAG TPA: toxic anion resistance protein [Dinghuibacter sp.]|uniref:toxic anion resistance protein n=1 Tax=Dinghuibacter sp. TaxID=2024697 RepID=UPI002CC6E082|nr:toxic anion resistance protein [Dinghuibacter sp.]HTJ12871.1 toxic anion resistance protein [Dinghuibacter sp.]
MDTNMPEQGMPQAPSAGLSGVPAQTGALPVMKLDKEGNVHTDALTTADTQKYGEINKALNPQDVNSILNYGSDLQGSMEKYSNDFLTSVRTFNSGETGTLINDLLTELKIIDIDELNQSPAKGFFSRLPFVKKVVMDVQKLFQKYDTVLNNIDKIVNKIKAGRINSIKDNSSLQTMFDNNVGYIHQMEDLIIAGQLKYEELKAQLEQMEANAANYQDYQIADMQDYVTRLDRRLADMKTVRFIMLQSLPQIRLVQNNNTTIAEKAQSITTTTIPVWKNQLTIAVALQRQKANVEMQQKVSETTNTILLHNAELLKQNSINVARENEKSVVSLDTLQKTTTSLIETLNEVKRIHDEGAQNRVVLNTELARLESELKKNVSNVK